MGRSPAVLCPSKVLCPSTARAGRSHLFFLLVLLVILVVVIVIVVIVAGIVLLVLLGGLLGLLVLLVLLLLDLVLRLPLGRELVRVSQALRDDNVVEDGASLDLPQVEANEAEVRVLVHLVVVDVLRVGDLLGLPEALVARVGDPLDGPLAFVVGVVDHGRLPLAILLVIPVVGLGGLGVDNALLLDPVLGLLGLGVVHHRVVDPVLRLLVLWIRDLLRLEDLPVLLDGALVDLLLVDLDADGVVRLEDHAVQVRGALLVLLVGQVGLLQHVLALVVEDEVGPLGVPALVRAEHDVVRGGVAEGGRVVHLRADLEVPATALDVLLILRLILDDQVLALVAERVEARRDAEELGV